MNENNLLLRQVHPSFIQDGKITSQVFRPTPKDEAKLSVYDNSKITPENSYKHFCSQSGFLSYGVMAVSKKECDSQELPVIEDNEPFPEHCHINFENLSQNQIEKKAKFLKRFADIRGCLHQAVI